MKTDMRPIPILFYGDSPDLQTGLGRIGRDLAVHCSSLPEFRVGYFGRGGTGSRQLPFAQYNFPESAQWGEDYIERAWGDFAGQEKGVIFTIWDASRLTWFLRPEGLAAAYPNLSRFLTSGQFQRWGYFPVDAAGIGGKLTAASREALRGCNRVLAYGAWGADVLSDSIGRAVDWIPHGLNFDVWRPRDKDAARMAAGMSDATIIGCVMTNQVRKDWGLACMLASKLKQKGNYRFWFHIDQLVRTDRWDLRALINDCGLADCVKVTISGSMSDTQLSYWYSACDLTILPSLGEGFGLPIVESLACGVPVVHGKYAGGMELIPRDDWLVEPVAWRVEGLANNVRPIYRPEDWLAVCEKVLGEKVTVDECRGAVDFLSWEKLWPAAWSKWFLEGLNA